MAKQIREPSLSKKQPQKQMTLPETEQPQQHFLLNRL